MQLPLISRDGFEQQRARYSGTEDLSLSIIENTGHMVMLERTAAEFRAKVSDWLKKRGF